MNDKAMTTAQQTHLIRRLRQMQATLAAVSYARDAAGHYADDRTSPAYAIGQCKGIVEGLLGEAWAEGR